MLSKGKFEIKIKITLCKNENSTLLFFYYIKRYCFVHYWFLSSRFIRTHGIHVEYSLFKGGNYTILNPSSHSPSFSLSLPQFWFTFRISLNCRSLKICRSLKLREGWILASVYLQRGMLWIHKVVYLDLKNVRFFLHRDILK